MAQQGNLSSRRNAPLLARTSDPRFLPSRLLDLHIIRKGKRSIRVMKFVAMCTSFLFLVVVSSSPFFLPRRPTSANLYSAAWRFWPSRLVLSAMSRYQRGLLNSSSLIPVTERLIRRSPCSGPAPSLMMMPLDWAISQTQSLTLLSIRCIVKPPLSCEIPMVSAGHWLTPTPAFSAQTLTWSVGIWIV